MMSHRANQLAMLLMAHAVASDEIVPAKPRVPKSFQSPTLTAEVEAIRAERLRRKALNFAKRQPKAKPTDGKTDAGEVKP